MKVLQDPDVHLTYCLNVHSGESWQENLSSIQEYTIPIRDRVCPDRPFGVGMRLSAAGSTELSKNAILDSFRGFLKDNNLYVFTVNAFPWGAFHGTTVKENVYSPDWSDGRRLEYTKRVADIMSEVMPEGQNGSISTVPVTYGPWADNDRLSTAVDNLAFATEYMQHLFEITGREIVLALEPEPHCHIETVSDALAFFNGPINKHGISRRFLGLCIDTSHQAVKFEDPAEDIIVLMEAGIRIAKIHLSSALSLTPTPDNLNRLRSFAEDTYLHQVSTRTGDGSSGPSFSDLPEALDFASSSPPDKDGKWRVHFHVPLFMTDCSGMSSTSTLLEGRFSELLKAAVCPHLEIETYTWSVLPEDMQSSDMVESITREFDWVLKNLLT